MPVNPPIPTSTTPVTLTGTMNVSDGTALQGNAFVRFTLRNYSGFTPRVSGTAIIVAVEFDLLPDTDGLITGTCWGNDLITPFNSLDTPKWNGTYYTIQFWNNGRITSSGNYVITGDTFDIDSANPLVTPYQISAGYLMTDIVQTVSSSQGISLNTNNNMFITAVGGLLGISLQLPDAQGLAGQQIKIIKTDNAAGPVTITGAFDSYSLTNQYQYVVFESDNTTWYAVGNN